MVQASEKGATHSLVLAPAVLSGVLARIDNTLAVATLLASEGGLRRDDTDIDTLPRLSIEDMRGDEHQRIRVERETHTCTAAMDPGLMRLALRNLIANALLYCAADSPVIVRPSDSDEPLALLINLIDAGAGLAPDLLPQMLERGVRGSHNQGSPGYGRALYTVKRVIYLHDGAVQVVSDLGRGTRMRLVVDQSLRA
jgi:signal transduction histidine kinase